MDGEMATTIFLSLRRGGGFGEMAEEGNNREWGEGHLKLAQQERSTAL